MIFEPYRQISQNAFVVNTATAWHMAFPRKRGSSITTAATLFYQLIWSNFQHLEELRQVRSAEEVASIQSDFVKESLEHAVQHARTFIQMVVTLPPELVQPVNPAVDAAGAARHAAAARIERLSEVASKD